MTGAPTPDPLGDLENWRPTGILQVPGQQVTATRMWQPDVSDPIGDMRTVARALTDSLTPADLARLAATDAMRADLMSPARTRSRPRPQRAARTRQAARWQWRETKAGRGIWSGGYLIPLASICRRSGHTVSTHKRWEAGW